MTPRRLRTLPALAVLLAAGCDVHGYDLSSGGHWAFPDAGPPTDGTVTADASPDACVPVQEVCDGLDNDCDGVVDNGFDLQRDPANCGECGHACDLPNAVTRCQDASCIMESCVPGHWDINHDPSDGCEYDCHETNDGTEVCDGRDNDCDGVIDNGFDFDNDPLNCGSCYNVCVFLNGNGACVNGQCTLGSCRGGYADANGDPNDGCECRMQLTEGTTVCTEGVPGTCAVGEVCADADNDGTSHCAPIPAEICDGKDNDCDGLIDAADDLSADARVGQVCYGDPDGLCATAAHAGVTACVNGQVQCTGANLLHANEVPETCNGVDDDCDGVVDDNPTDAGASCGVSANYPCALGTMLCVNHTLQCVGAINPAPNEVCNGVDDNCDGIVDNNPTDAGGPCNAYPPPPPGATSPCVTGTLQCQNGGLQCVNSVGPTSTVDSCGVDANCDGVLTNQPDLQSDVHNCGSCGHDCLAGKVHEIWTCDTGNCVRHGCEAGYWDLDHNGSCEYACIPLGSEVCNNQDDDCDGHVDNGLTTPTTQAVCGVSPAATRPECTTQVQVQCVNGGWQCTFPAGVCNGSLGCSNTVEICDNLDNDCDGSLNENVPLWHKTCYSDAGLPPPGHGACRTAGLYQCNGPNDVVCDAVKADCNTLPGGCEEVCDGIDNDCDGKVDEYKTENGGTDPYYVKPAVVKVASSLWVMAYEASRPDADNTTPGVGNGYHCASGCGSLPVAPAGVTLDKTYACSEPGVLPWFNVTPVEAEQTCNAIGAHLCTTAEWTSICQVDATCYWGYSPSTSAGCRTSYTASKYCNLGPFDFSTSETGDQDGLLPTASTRLANCWADWSGLQGNPTTANKVFDLTGNLREITKQATNVYPLMGGSFTSSSDAGATCTFSFYAVNTSFALWDTGFRCCFSSDPN